MEQGKWRNDGTGYGAGLSLGRNLRAEVEEVRQRFGGESNGLGRKGHPTMGYRVVGEYTYGVPRGKRAPAWSPNPRPGVPGGGEGASTGEGTSPAEAPKPGRPRKKGKPSRTKAYTETEFHVARARVGRKYEQRRGAKVDRRRQNLKTRRKAKDLEGEKRERLRVLGRNTKRTKAEERCEAVALSGVLPTGERRTKLRARELEQGVNHVGVRRSVEALRTHHAKSSVYGRKKPDAGADTPGYYGYKVRVKGPLGGARRTMTYVIRNGTVPNGTIRARRREHAEHAKTKIGTLGIKVTYTYGLG